MKRLKVLFLTYCYPPHKSPRSIQISHLVKYLRDEFVLQVITSYPDNNIDQSLLTFTSLDNVRYADKSNVTRFIERSKGDRIKKIILPDFHYPWHFDLYRKTSEIIEKSGADVIVTFGHPMSTHIAGLKLKKKYPYVKWVAHFSDPWVENLFNNYNAWVKFVNQYYQDAVFHIADNLIFTSHETIKLATDKYLKEIQSKTFYLPHIFNESLYASKDENEQTQNFLTIRYMGNFYGNRQPDCLFEALQYIQKDQLKHIRIELIGSATITNDLIQKYNLEKIIFKMLPVPYLDSLSLMKNSDLLLIIDAPTMMSPFLPSKLIDYIGANKPIFGITPPGTSQKLIEKMGFLVAHPNNPKEIAEQLVKMIQNIKNKKIPTIPTHIRSQYSAETVGKQMHKILKEIVL